jgi:hypothetical protein
MPRLEPRVLRALLPMVSLLVVLLAIFDVQPMSAS